MGALIDYREHVALAARAVRVRPGSFTWFGRPSRPLSPWLRTPELVRRHLVGQLARTLYFYFYTCGRPVPAIAGHAAMPRGDPALIDALSAENASTGGWERGWSVLERDGDALRLALDGLRVRAPAVDYDPPDGLRLTHEERTALPGYYLVRGATPDAALQLRVYVRLTSAAAAPALVRAITRGLDASFALKIVTEPTALERLDTAVLYLDEHGFEPARDILRGLSDLRAGAPPFTKPLAPGIAVAEHVPAHGASFGTHRCRLVAEGLVDAYERGVRELSGRVDAVGERFASVGLDLERPYLAPGSDDRYEL